MEPLQPHPLVLASSSPYRQQLLARLRLSFDVCAPHVDESPVSGESAANVAVRLAAAKVSRVLDTYPGSVVIGGDQTAECGSTMLGKPGDFETNVAQLMTVQGQTVRFNSAICVINGINNRRYDANVITDVTFRRLTYQQIEQHVAAEPAFDCAGGFKAEGLGISLCAAISGSDPTAITGLPLIEVCNGLDAVGFRAR